MTKPREYRSLRDAFAQFATGVTVVSANNQQGRPIGITANSFASVSLEPPLVSWCIDKKSTRFEEFIEATYFTISVLTAKQEDVSNLFAQRSWDETAFEDVDWYAGLNDVPQIADVSARFHCQTEHKYAGGDHIIIVGAVLEYESEPQEPLIFFQGEYKY
ncbi:MAG: flavin reductase family protein [Acidiferrobacterales bacterium]|nr:flavin reductase family protein [Acidiferrobacterales bacterium]